MSDRDERERLARLRDRQLQSRDPQIKQRKLQGHISQQWKSTKPPTFWEMVKKIPYSVRGAMIGAAIGVVVWIVLNQVWNSPWANMAALVVALVLTIFGIVLGQGFDAREELKDELRRW
ncbi:MAG: hypothetical protein JW850_11670 [Thermoflexales bacterium]|nr:hypothetical protein [Thermoflexales bacterium]